MIKSNSKAAKEAFRNHVIECYQDVATDDGITVKEALTKDVCALMGGADKLSLYDACVHLVEVGQFEVYNFGARSVLEDALQETTEESEKYNDNIMWAVYCRLVGRAVYDLITPFESEVK